MAKVLFKIIYSDEFIDNAAKIYEYHLGNFAPDKAERIISSALQNISLLQSNPLLFVKAESKKFPDCRKIVIEEYIILYIVHGKSVIIINIIAGTSDWKQ